MIKTTIITVIFSLLFINNAFSWWNGHINNIETSLPNNIYDYSGEYLNDINIRTSKLNIKDRNLDEYIVIPKNWLVIPINKIEKENEDFDKIINFENIDVNKYLKNWSLVFPTKENIKYWWYWNISIMWHSSYKKNDDWRYKTHFQLIIWLEKWTEIWIFKKENWNYKRYRYKVTESYNTEATDIKILKQKEKKELTLFTCTPIWWTETRWIIKSEYIEEINISIKNKKIIDEKIIKKILNIEDINKRNNYINKILEKIIKVKTNNIKIKNILKYLEKELNLIKKD